ncbi:IS5 family transposase [Streptomyces sp. NPDC059003]|uniref:IS5 family transposase n=1 Tax=Streptomyces sp. NPDC059003 TaxID=3346691 RepID=UPI0036CA07F7
MPALPSWLTDPLWDQFCELLPMRGEFVPDHPLGCHRRRIGDRIVFDKIVQVLVFGCGYRKVADVSCSATTIRGRRDEWITAGVFERLELIVLELSDLPVDGCHTKAPCGGEVAGPSPVDRRKGGMKRSTATDAGGIPARRGHRPWQPARLPLLAPTLKRLERLGPLPDGATVHLDAAYGTDKRARTAEEHGLRAEVAVKGVAAPIQNTRRWPVERTNAWGNQFFKIARCTERRAEVTDAYLSMAHAIITLRRLIRRSWSLYRWDTRPAKRP